jgi:hypothetical protein
MTSAGGQAASLDETGHALLSAPLPADLLATTTVPGTAQARQEN